MKSLILGLGLGLLGAGAAMGQTAVLTDTQTFSGGNTFTSSVTLASDATFLSNNRIMGSSVTMNFLFDSIAHSFGVCGTTIAITLPTSAPIRVWYSGSIGSGSGSGSYQGSGFLIDGKFDPPLNNIYGVVSDFVPSSENYGHPGSWTWVTTVQPAGLHRLCLTAMSNNNNVLLCRSVPGSVGSTCQFGAEIVP